MKVGIASAGRFHLLDLARELDQLGVEATFYSYVPKWRAQKFGLPVRCHCGLLPFVVPIVMWQRWFNDLGPTWRERLMVQALNRIVAQRLRPCDVFVCLSGLYLEAAQYARSEFGAKIWLERGSRHILSQVAILKDCGVERLPARFVIERELAGYEIADRIVVPSSHVAESFVERDPSLMPKLFVNPYGVDLEQFPQHQSSAKVGPKTVLFVGSWSRRKGADILVDAIQRLDCVRLLHVGAIVDVPFPFENELFEHVEAVPQWRLQDYYRRAHLFVLASREEGLALVQLQALASGLPLVCTARTGGEDLRLSRALADRITIAAPDDLDALTRALGDSLERLSTGDGIETLSRGDRSLLSWQAYGRRYCQELLDSIEEPQIAA